MKSFADSIRENKAVSEMTLCEMFASGKSYHADENPNWDKFIRVIDNWTVYAMGRDQERRFGYEDFLIREVFSCKNRSMSTKYNEHIYRGTRKKMNEFKAMNMKVVPPDAYATRGDMVLGKGRYRSKHKVQSWSRDIAVADDFRATGSPSQRSWSRIETIGLLMGYKPNPDTTLNISGKPPIISGLMFNLEAEVIVADQTEREVSIYIEIDEYMSYLAQSMTKEQLKQILSEPLSAKSLAPFVGGEQSASNLLKYDSIKAAFERIAS